jgi:hypothetical protein
MKIPRKNIFKKIMDIRSPGALRAGDADHEDRVAPQEAVLRRPDGERERPARATWKSVVLAVVVLVVFGGGFWVFASYESKKALLLEAEKSFTESGLASRINFFGNDLEIRNWTDVTEKILPMLKGGIGAYKELMAGAAAWTKLGGDAKKLSGNITEFLAGNGEGEVLAPLKELAADVGALRKAFDALESSGERLGQTIALSPEEYLDTKLELAFWDRALSSLSEWLVSDRRIAVFLENPSEMRPTGGFWGSYAEINIRGGKLAGVIVRDVNEPDRLLGSKTVPPKPLQALVANWRAADSNWFFNFPDSAAKGAGFLSASKLYEGGKIDMLAAVSSAVIGDILSVTGPVNVSSTKTAIDENNFLAEIQNSVQKNQEARAADSKKILDELFAALAPKIAALDDAEIGAIISSGLGSKDIRLWAGDARVQSLLEERGIAGAVFEIPQKFQGDYLAVAVANIGGGKSDYVMSQKITLESRISPEGEVQNHLEISRKNNAKSTDKWWYKVANQSYIRIFLPPTSRLSAAKGGLKKTVSAPVNYKTLGYATDPLVKEIESTAEVSDDFPWLTSFSEAGKYALGAWVKTASGETSKLSYDYSRRLFLAPADGVAYQFVMDKQPGVVSEYALSFTAPVGFVWEQSGSPVYEYKGSDIPARLTIRLTLRRE